MVIYHLSVYGYGYLSVIYNHVKIRTENVELKLSVCKKKRRKKVIGYLKWFDC